MRRGFAREEDLGPDPDVGEEGDEENHDTQPADPLTNRPPKKEAAGKTLEIAEYGRPGGRDAHDDAGAPGLAPGPRRAG